MRNGPAASCSRSIAIRTPNDFLDEIAAAAYGTEETAELIPLETVERCLAAARGAGQTLRRYFANRSCRREAQRKQLVN